MGERVYALKMAKLLDPDYTYFKSRVIARGDCNLSDRKGLDVILGKKSATLILDDTQTVIISYPGIYDLCTLFWGVVNISF